MAPTFALWTGGRPGQRRQGSRSCRSPGQSHITRIPARGSKCGMNWLDAGCVDGQAVQKARESRSTTSPRSAGQRNSWLFPARPPRATGASLRLRAARARSGSCGWRQSPVAPTSGHLDFARSGPPPHTNPTRAGPNAGCRGKRPRKARKSSRRHNSKICAAGGRLVGAGASVVPPTPGASILDPWLPFCYFSTVLSRTRLQDRRCGGRTAGRPRRSPAPTGLLILGSR
jgi:hypothetical protein